MELCKRKGVPCEYITDYSTCNSANCLHKLPDVNAGKYFTDSTNNKDFAIGVNPSPWTLHITNCKEVEFTVNGIKLTADLGNVDLSTYEAIELNGYRFERVKEKLETVDQALDEIKRLETILEADKYSDSVYNSFREEVCTYCHKQCLKSKVDICGCRKFENYFEI